MSAVSLVLPQDSAMAPPAPAPVATEGQVAYVPRAGGPPDTSAYMWAGYAITALCYGGYVWLLLRRMARERAFLRR
jgi:hypothetical protein